MKLKSSTPEQKELAQKIFHTVGDLMSKRPTDLIKLREIKAWLAHPVAFCLKAQKKKKQVTLRPLEEEYIGEAPFDKESGLLAISELGLAWRFAERIGNVLYNHSKGKWLNWDGHRWNETIGTAYVWRKAETVAKEAVEEVNRLDSISIKKRLLPRALACQQKSWIANMLALAQTFSRYETYASHFDTDPYLLNCLNGTIDLRTGTLREHQQTDFITKLCPVEYDEYINEPDNPNRCELWYECLDDWTNGNKAFQKYLQQAAGYSITGDTSLEVLFLLLSSLEAKQKARTGKSTFIEAVTTVLGDYALVVPFETFLQQKYSSGGHRADVARLEGARFVAAVEMDEGRKLAQGLVKSVTGGDKIAAAYKFKDWFEFKPQFKLWLAANSPPHVDYKDEAMWERMVQLPFDHYFSKKDRDPDVKKKLRNPQIAGPTILFWLVEGCREWLENPQQLKVPFVVRQATEQYRDEMNPLKKFFADCCIFSKEAECVRAKPFERYQEYCNNNQIRHRLLQSEFNDELENLGCRQTRKYILKRQIWIWQGIKVN